MKTGISTESIQATTRRHPHPSLQVEQENTLGLVRSLCEELNFSEITYCHWKSNNMLSRSATGENDLDFLVSREDVQLFTEVLYKLGFRQAYENSFRKMPGVLDYYGFDQTANKFIHVHAHYQLILGQDATKNYRLPIERPYLESVSQGDLFKIPAPEFELVVFVIRMVLKHSTWDMILCRLGALSKTELQEMVYLQNRISPTKLHALLKQHLPYLDAKLFDSCVQTLQPNCPFWFRVRTGQQLQNRLRAYARRPQFVDTCLKVWRRVALPIQRRIFRRLPKKRFASGGLMIAIVGGDGAGKTTAVDELQTWLSEEFETFKVHMGKPRWSSTTIIIRGILKIGRSFGFYPFMRAPIKYSLDSNHLEFPGYPWLLREVCTARDRYLTYIKARCFASNGGIVICDRYPLPQVKLMDSPQIERFTQYDKTNRFINFLIELEKSYYRPITLPDVMVVLLADPEIAVQRKLDETPESVRARSREIWELDWQQAPAHIIDAGDSKAEVLTELKNFVWSQL